MSYAQINGLKMSYEIQGEGTPLLLIHGLSTSKDLFESFIDDLAQHFQVITYNQRGIGDSEAGYSKFDMGDLANDAIALLDYLKIDKVHVFGVSMGGMIIQEILLRFPNRIDRSIMACTFPGGAKHGVVPPREGDLALAYSVEPDVTNYEKAAALVRIFYTPDYIEKHPELVDTWAHRRKSNPLDKIVVKRYFLYLNYDAYARLASVDKPVLVMTGEQDQVVPSENSRRLAKQLASAELVVFDPCGHELWVQCREEMLAEIFRFLNN